MKPNVWNIRDILSIPTTSMVAKSGKGSATSEYSSLSDSQFLFGSQFWPENSQGFSQEISGPYRGSQSASQEVNEMKVSSSYHSKPLLFGDGKAANITGGKTLGILDRFEEEKRKAKENEILAHGFRQLLEGLENIKRTFLNFADGRCDITQKTVAEGIAGLKKTIQDDLANIREKIAGQAEMLVNLQNQTQREIKGSEAKTTLAVKDLSSLVLSLQQDLDSLRVEQRKEQSVFEEIQSLLGKIMAAYSAETHSRPIRMTDNTVQTSPGLVGTLCVNSRKNHNCKSMEMCTSTIHLSEERVDHGMCPVKAEPPGKLNTSASFRVLAPVSIDNQKQLFSHTVAEKSYCTHSVLTSAVSPAITATDNAELQRSYIVGAPVCLEPVKPSDDLDENRFKTRKEVLRQNKIPKRGQRRQHFRRKKRALVLPQRRQNTRMSSFNIFEDTQLDEEQENRMPLSMMKTASKNHIKPTKQQGTAGLMNRGECAQHLNPWSWSQSSNSSQMMVEYKKAEQETMMSEHKTNTLMRQRGIWQLFDFISDSD